MVHALGSWGLRVLLLRVLVVHGNGHHRLGRYHGLCSCRMLELAHGGVLVLGTLEGVCRGLRRVEGVVIKAAVTNGTPHRC